LSITNPASENVIFNYPVDCKILGGNCEIIVDQEYDSKNPHFVVLEKLNSNEDVYFSDAITVPWDYLQRVEWKVWIGEEPEEQYPLKLIAFEIKKPNQLIIQFEGVEKKSDIEEDEAKEKAIPSFYYPILILIIIVLIVIIFIWFLIRKRRNF